METEHFSSKELTCPCGCNKNFISPLFMNKVERLRVEYGKPIILSSAFRCPEYNERVSSTGITGPHTMGAVDIKVYGIEAFRILQLAFKFKFSGIGIQQKGNYASRFIHLDDLWASKDRRRPRVWSY